MGTCSRPPHHRPVLRRRHHLRLHRPRPLAVATPITKPSSPSSPSTAPPVTGAPPWPAGSTTTPDRMTWPPIANVSAGSAGAPKATAWSPSPCASHHRSPPCSSPCSAASSCEPSHDRTRRGLADGRPAARRRRRAPHHRRHRTRRHRGGPPCAGRWMLDRRRHPHPRHRHHRRGIGRVPSSPHPRCRVEARRCLRMPAPPHPPEAPGQGARPHVRRLRTSGAAPVRPHPALRRDRPHPRRRAPAPLRSLPCTAASPVGP